MEEQLDLFSGTEKPTNIPLAEKVRPASLDDIIGQDELLKENSALKMMFETGKFSSFIMWGPPGCGKTTIARLIDKIPEHRFIAFSAVLSGIKDVKTVMNQAEYELKTSNKSTIIFVDEIHRFNKSQQDAFLPYIESGAIILIGATTENPSFEVIPALLSRCHVFVLKKLADDDLKHIIKRTLKLIDKEKLFDENSISFIAELVGGDARMAVNYVELILRNSENTTITPEYIGKLLSRKAMFFDKKGEEHYNTISALHKSLRGSDAQAGLYWLARMLESGEDPMYIVRRLIRFASEDVGLADPNALVQAIAVKDSIRFLGMPESNTALGQLVVYLATAPKSNSVYTAYKKAAIDAHKTGHMGVPMVIRNAPTKLMKDLKYGENYKYAHDQENSYYYQKYFPDKMNEEIYYEPSKFGFEKDIRKRLDWWKKLKDKQKK